MKKPNIVIIADNIRSLYNVGSIFRICDAIGAEKLILVGLTATPKTQPIRLAKTSLGAENSVVWEKVTTVSLAIKRLKKAGYEIIGLELNENKSIDYRSWNPSEKVAIILGNEVKGLSLSVQRQCDKVIHLPMLGQKNSLNVTTAFSAIAYYILSKIK